MKIAILGAGAIGLGMAALLSQKSIEVSIWAPSAIGAGPLLDGGPVVASGEISGHFAVSTTTNIAAAVEGARVVILAVPGTAHKAVIDRLVPHLTCGQLVAISSHMSLSGLYLQRELSRLGVVAPVAAWATTVVTGRRTQPGRVLVTSRRRRVSCAYLPASVEVDARRLLANLFGNVFHEAPDLMTVTLMNTNPTTHLAIALCNVTRMEYGERWGTYHGLSEAVGRLAEALDRERIMLAQQLGTSVHTIREHLHSSFGLPLGAIGAMAAEQHRRRNGEALGPTTLDHRYVTEDVPFGIVPLVTFGRVAGVPMPLHEAGLKLIDALYDRCFEKENDILADLRLEGLPADALTTLCRDGYPVAALTTGCR